MVFSKLLDLITKMDGSNDKNTNGNSNKSPITTSASATVSVSSMRTPTAQLSKSSPTEERKPADSNVKTTDAVNSPIEKKAEEPKEEPKSEEPLKLNFKNWSRFDNDDE